jgi:esterase
MKLAYRKYGEGKAIIILHGLFGQMDNWNTLAKKFSEQGFAVYTIDQRNHGLSPHDDDWNYGVMADDLKDFINEHQIQNPILLGHSMGGKTVMYFSLHYPNIADKLIIADISPRQHPANHNDVLYALQQVDFEVVKTRREVEDILAATISDFGTRQFLLKNVYWKTDDKMDWRFNLKIISEKYNNVIVGVPRGICETETLFLKGEKSDYINDNDLVSIKEIYPNSSVEVIADAGHWVHAEQPELFYKAVMGFIGD